MEGGCVNKWIIKCLKNSISEKGNYCYSLPVETTKAVIKELNRLNNIINKLEEYCWELKAMGCREGALDMLDKIEELKNGDNK